MVLSLFVSVRATARDDLNALDRKYEKSEDDLKAVQNVGQIIGEVLKQLDDERSTHAFFKYIITYLLCVQRWSLVLCE
jgi:hypothetical protein